jgi:phosphoribosylformylglycinamidine synthase
MPIKAKVYVSLKRTVLDPQGTTIANALKKMDYKGVEDVRQGKYFEITFGEGAPSDKAAIQIEIERIAREVLTNPVIEEFSWTLEDSAQPAVKA